MAKGVLNSGAKPARGGKREGAGRKPDWLRAECAKILEDKELLAFMGRVASGEETEQHLDKDGNVYEIRPRITDRIKAVEFLSDRAHGKPSQAVEVSGQDGSPLKIEIVSYSPK